jgi:hypothetical protein
LITSLDISLKVDGTTSQLLSITKLVIFGLEDKLEGQSFQLVQTEPTVWKVVESIEL